VPTRVNTIARTVTGTTNHFTSFGGFNANTNLTVRVNPFGTQPLANGPFQVQAVDLGLTPTTAPADITVTLRRNVISKCRQLLFSSVRTVTISAGQSVGGSLDAAGADPQCNTDPITTQWTICQAVVAPSTTLDLSGVPSAQLSVAIVRGSLTGAPIPPVNPCVKVLVNGKELNKDVTGIQPAVVGEPISLSAQIQPLVSLGVPRPCGPLADQNWNGLAATVGRELRVTRDAQNHPVSGATIPTDTSGNTTTFYWVTPGLGRNVTYTYTDPTCGSASATVAFNVRGPALNVSIPTGSVRVDPVGTIEFGCADTGRCSAGITFTIFVLPTGNSGLDTTGSRFMWVQLVDQDTVQVTRGGLVGTCGLATIPVPNTFPALDNTFPYDTGSSISDSPSVTFTGNATNVARTFKARMYLLWQSSANGSIAVPLGSAAWSATGEAKFDAAAQQWQPVQASNGILLANPLRPWIPSSGDAPGRVYPTWNSLALNAKLRSCS
jgi:hypothetical protein